MQGMFLKADGDEIDADERQEILSYLPQGKEILELGAGIGRFTTEFAKQADRVAAVELMPHFLEENRQRNQAFKTIEYVCADAMDAVFAVESFDLIFLNSLMMYLDELEVLTLIERFHTWLKPGGHLFFRETCAAVEKHFFQTYYVTYRTLHFYTRIFDQRWKLLKQDSIKLFELRYAHPFHCFWLYHKVR